ncbi:Radical SAM domain protein [Acidimicrobium ferrooxidans DSM 10331]|uniref:FO synthase n=1 Tax=Acidimicrobium ferrooxidans (strain DSM 10331 / JCM 15462 / NBRC 103882 / ICP) TaxID=525909 RepID=C7LYN7_ACIFD|nr:5-amino-6-(D-ribitylamino)uracil--L-tyrosine 4-hydroxyphenyl transferase CofH [Acidimicrobium ferrooxidans]ACU53845.1 Radical SAM domain protein [Acidimicrobium ferrooxidans DSM 10331]
MTKALLEWSTNRLLAEAARRRDRTFGPRITYSPKVFIPLTRLCRDRCDYCTFATVPARLGSAFLSLDEVRALARKGAAVGAAEALFTLGERPELRWSSARDALRSLGAATTLDYLRTAADVAIAEGLLPHLNPGTLTPEEVASLRPHAVSMGTMLESIRPDLPVHRNAPDKDPDLRLATVRAMALQHVPTTSGILVGIGDSEADRLRALEALAAIAEETGFLQEVIVQNFLPKPGTRLRHAPPADHEAHLRTIALARLVLPPTVHVQAPPNLSDDIEGLLSAGIDDLGGISRVTPDHVNPERPWPEIELLERRLAEAGRDLVPRLALYPEYARRDDAVDDALRPAVRASMDRDGFAREHQWFSGRPGPLPPRVVTVSRRAPAGWFDELEAASRSGEGPSLELLEHALSARGTDAQAVIDLADALRRETNGDVVTFVQNRNINYTNQCTFGCGFCAFSRGPRSLALRGAPYLLSMEQILAKVAEAAARGATEVCLQGGIHPRFDGGTYLDIAEAIHERFPAMHIHAFSALEVFEGSRRLGWPLDRYLSELAARGVRSLPGTAAEILDDEVRAVICPEKLTTDQWLEVHETAHAVGLRSNVTIMFGTVETTTHTARHLMRTRALGTRTRGFTEFVPLPFVHMGAPIFLAGRARRGPTLREAVLLHAVGRIAYHGVIDNVQASWVKMGPAGAVLLLDAGANDLGGTLMEESISHAAGAAHASELTVAELGAIAAQRGRHLVQRTTFYEHLMDVTIASTHS